MLGGRASLHPSILGLREASSAKVETPYQAICCCAVRRSAPMFRGRFASPRWRPLFEQLQLVCDQVPGDCYGPAAR